jgi:hypothetical protein
VATETYGRVTEAAEAAPVRARRRKSKKATRRVAKRSRKSAA